MFKSSKRLKLAMLYFCTLILLLTGYAAAQSLCDCAMRGDIQKVNLLISQGADVKMVNWAGVTPFHFAADRGHKDVVQLLISKGANINAVDRDGVTSLHRAARYGHKDVVELKGADVNVVNSYGLTPLTLATIAEEKDVMELLVKQGGHE